MYPIVYREMAVHGRMSTKQLAEHLGITPKTLGKKLSKESHFNINEMRAIQKLFGGIPLDDLFANDAQQPAS